MPAHRERVNGDVDVDVDDVSMNADNASKRQLGGASTTMHTGLRYAPRLGDGGARRDHDDGSSDSAVTTQVTASYRSRSNYRRDACVHRVEARGNASFSRAAPWDAHLIRDHRAHSCECVCIITVIAAAESATTPKFP